MPDTSEAGKSDALRGSWTFSVRTQSGRVVVSVSNKVLQTCFGMRHEDDPLQVFASHVSLLRCAALVRIEKGFVQRLVLCEEDVAVARESISPKLEC